MKASNVKIRAVFGLIVVFQYRVKIEKELFMDPIMTISSSTTQNA